MSSTTNIPINTRSMNGIITISDGVATMENGNLTNVDNLDANNMNSAVLTTTTQPPHSNNNDVATTAYVYNELIDYALLNPITQTFTGINIFGTLNSNTPSINTNSTRVATTAYVKTNLLNYGLLNPVTPQTFSGSNNFSTQLITDNSTLCATTAYVKNQNYITSLSLTPFGLLDPPTTQIWGNATTPQENWWYGDTFSYAGIESVNGFYVKSDPGLTATTYALIDSIGSISTTSTIDSIGIISSDTGFNIPRISPLTTINNNGTISQTSTGTNSLFNTTFTGTSNQINIKAFVNAGPSTISQNAGTLTISAVTNNASPATNLILATRGTANGGCVLFNGNSTTLAIAQNTGTLNLQAVTTTNISSPTFNVTSTTTNFNGIVKFNSTTTPTITNIISLSDNTQKIATTAFVKGQLYITATALIGYAQLAMNQTFTGINTFAQSAGNVIFNGGSLYNDTVGGASSSFMTQSGVVCTIGNNHDLGSVTLSTRTSLGVPRDNVYAINGNQAGLRGNSGNTIDITGTQATIGGTSVPVITTQPNSITSNNNEIASTKFVRDQAYITTSSLTPYALLTANQTFTGTDIFSNSGSTVPLVIKSNTSGIGNTNGYQFIASANTQYNSLVDAGDYVVFAGDSTGAIANANLTLTSLSNTKVGIKITQSYIDLYGDVISQNAPYNCGYLQLPVPFTTKTNYDQGFINTILFAGFTGNAWATSSGAYNIMSISWNGFNNYTLGVWQVEIVIISQCTSAPTISFTWNTLSATSMSLNSRSGCVSDIGAYAGVGASIFRMSFILNVTDLLKNYFLNCSRVGGTGLVSDSNSYIKFTRIA